MQDPNVYRTLKVVSSNGKIVPLGEAFDYYYYYFLMKNITFSVHRLHHTEINQAIYDYPKLRGARCWAVLYEIA